MVVRRDPGWKRLWRHSYWLGLRWLLRDASSRWAAGKAGFVRLVVPLDPWRYYELGRVADERFDGACLDISSPKLLTSLLAREGQGAWTATDLFSREIQAWSRIDPALDLQVEDATDLSYADGSFDNVLCISVLEHIGRGPDVAALEEMWRVLAPGGVLHLTTDVARTAQDVFTDEPAYGEASSPAGDRSFFKHDYSIEEFDEIVAATPWLERHREYAAQRRPGIESAFYGYRPWTYLVGPLLRWICPRNFVVSPGRDIHRRTGTRRRVRAAGEAGCGRARCLSEPIAEPSSSEPPARTARISPSCSLTRATRYSVWSGPGRSPVVSRTWPIAGSGPCSSSKPTCSTRQASRPGSRRSLPTSSTTSRV